jgi:hypothetical protein
MRPSMETPPSVLARKATAPPRCSQRSGEIASAATTTMRCVRMP